MGSICRYDYVSPLYIWPLMSSPARLSLTVERNENSNGGAPRSRSIYRKVMRLRVRGLCSLERLDSLSIRPVE